MLLGFALVLVPVLEHVPVRAHVHVCALGREDVPDADAVGVGHGSVVEVQDNAGTGDEGVAKGCDTADAGAGADAAPVALVVAAEVGWPRQQLPRMPFRWRSSFSCYGR